MSFECTGAFVVSIVSPTSQLFRIHFLKTLSIMGIYSELLELVVLTCFLLPGELGDLKLSVSLPLWYQCTGLPNPSCQHVSQVRSALINRIFLLCMF